MKNKKKILQKLILNCKMEKIGKSRSDECNKCIGYLRGDKV